MTRPSARSPGQPELTVALTVLAQMHDALGIGDGPWILHRLCFGSQVIQSGNGASHEDASRRSRGRDRSRHRAASLRRRYAGKGAAAGRRSVDLGRFVYRPQRRLQLGPLEDHRRRSTTPATARCVATGQQTIKLNGPIFGGQIGFNRQRGNWVWGVEADGQWSGQKGDGNFICPTFRSAASACNAHHCRLGAGVAPTASFHQKLDWFVTVRGRLGLLVQPTWLAYVTGGLAVGHFETNGVIAGFAANNAPMAAAFNYDETRFGWTVGGGLEGRLTGNWTAKLEYLYADYGTVTGQGFLPTAFPPLRVDFSSKVTDHVLRVGLNYKWGPDRDRRAQLIATSRKLQRRSERGGAFLLKVSDRVEICGGYLSALLRRPTSSLGAACCVRRLGFGDHRIGQQLVAGIAAGLHARRCKQRDGDNTGERGEGLGHGRLLARTARVTGL